MVRTHVADVGVRQAHNLSGVAWIGENFLVSGEAGIKNDFAATTGSSPRRAPVKNSPILERDDRATFGGLRQCVLRRMSFRCRVNG
jgi:hypothetical protein